ncbi:MAG: peptidylprolyl isomerase [Gammaproteobacteria bacterium]|nr:peptidylprolyl isomerase [Gammaproteobacteria bacterium]
MQIEKDKVVSIHYVLSEGDRLLEQSYSSTPLAYLHGHSNMMPGVEKALEGKSKGDKITITLSPDEAYGNKLEDMTQRVSVNYIMREGKTKPKLQKGMIVKLNSKNGPVPVTVLKVGLKMIDVDTNHPYAGMSLTYDIEVMDVRDATQDEISHRHAHGTGGVEH